jgi:hypothetical protein
MDGWPTTGGTTWTTAELLPDTDPALLPLPRPPSN